MPRWAGKAVVIVCAVVLALGGLGLPSAGMMGPGSSAAAAHNGAGHDRAPDDQQNSENSGDCCMLACVPVILNTSSPANVRLHLEGKIAPIAANHLASHRSEPPFHPPRRA